MTGCFPGTLNVPGIYWFDRSVYGKSRTRLRGYRTYLGPYRVEKLNRDVTPGTPVIADVWPDARYVFGWYTRGSPKKALLGKFAKVTSFIRGFLTKDWLRSDGDAEKYMFKAINTGASFVFVMFPSPDELGHRFGPKSDEVKQAYLRMDQTIGRLFDQLSKSGEAESTLVVMASDHGQSDTHTHFALDDYVAERFGRTMIYKRMAGPIYRVKAVVLPNGNGMANVYFKGQAWTAGRPDMSRDPYREFIAELQQKEMIDILAWRGAEGWIQVSSRRGSARLKEMEPGILGYEPAGSDPFGYPDLRGNLPFERILTDTAESDYPDAPVSIATFFRAARAPDLLVTSQLGFDLRTWWEYQEPHGTHGSLHWEHSLVPVLANVSLNSGPLRTVDLFPTMAKLTGRDIPPGVEGICRA
jgi:hypothetical protein